jgi:hypothetical protein
MRSALKLVDQVACRSGKRLDGSGIKPAVKFLGQDARKIGRVARPACAVYAGTDKLPLLRHHIHNGLG